MKPAARHRGRAPEGPGAADPGRAGERARPRGDRRGARAASAGSAREGRTVFVSSHILSEVQQTADRVAILLAGPVRSPPGPSTRCSPPGRVGRVDRQGSTTSPAGLRRCWTPGIGADAARRAACAWSCLRRRRPASRARSPTAASTSPSSARTRSTSRRSSSSSRRRRRNGSRVDARRGCGGGAPARNGDVMIALLASEFLRFWSRRLVRIVAALVVLGIVVAGVIVFATQSLRPRLAAGGVPGHQLRLRHPRMAVRRVVRRCRVACGTPSPRF